MQIVPVIFEDHNLVRMRPLTWSIPVFEVRCGMFNTRERVGMCGERNGGVLLGRELLGGLHTASGWETGAGSLSLPQWKNSRFLFLNGMLAPDLSLIRGLLEGAFDRPDFVWQNDEGLVAALVAGPVAERVGQDWECWDRENAAGGAWTDPAQSPGSWTGGGQMVDGPTQKLPLGGQLQVAAAGQDRAADLTRYLGKMETLQTAGPRWIWDLVAATRPAIMSDLDFVKNGAAFRREPFGIFPAEDNPAPSWLLETALTSLASPSFSGSVSRLVVDDPEAVFCAEGVGLASGTALNTTQGPIILDRDVRVMPQSYLEGPLYIGPGSLVKPGTRIHGESSFGMVNRLAGEIAESTFGDFANKQHEGFIGHAILGSWINLGAMTTCSDLKNNYGEIRVDLGSGTVATGQHFVGLMMGDHAKTAIGTLFNTGTSVGFATNIFGSGMPPKYVGNFLWGGQKGCPSYSEDRARDTAGIVMGRRWCRFTSAHGQLFKALS